MPKRSYHRVLDEHLHVLISQGNHEAYVRLKKRYRYHCLTLCKELMSQYFITGINTHELISVCDSCFLPIVKKFDPTQTSFFSFWKNTTLHYIMQYMVENGYIIPGESFKSPVSLDQTFEDKHSFYDVICERDDEQIKKRKISEIKNILSRHKDEFSSSETTLLKFVLEGYSIADLEYSGVMRKSALYLTFNSAVEKLKNIIKNVKTNKR